MEIRGGGGKSCQALWNGKSWGVGLKLEKTLPGGGGMDIFWNHTFIPVSISYTHLFSSSREYNCMSDFRVFRKELLDLFL